MDSLQKLQQQQQSQLSPKGRSSSKSAAASPEVWEQQRTYLRQALSGLAHARGVPEMQALGRVICALLGIEESTGEGALLMEAIGRIPPMSSSTLDSFTALFSSSAGSTPSKRSSL